MERCKVEEYVLIRRPTLRTAPGIDATLRVADVEKRVRQIVNTLEKPSENPDRDEALMRNRPFNVCSGT
jgi:hypothetical protein